MESQSQRDQDDPDRRAPAPSGCTWPAAVAVIAIACLLAVLFYFVIHGPGFVAKDLADTAAKLRGMFGTEVHIENHSVTLESRQILELATVQHRIVCVTKYSTTWAGSTATVIVRGVYTAKAGFKLEKNATFRFDDQGRILDGSMPNPSVLSIESVSQEIFHAEQGVLKVLEPKDYQEAFRQNRLQAEVEAVNMGMLDEARERLKERLADVLPHAAASVTPRPD